MKEGITMARTEKENVASNPLNEEMVTIKLFKDNGKYKDDVFVSRNGKNMIIKRGVEVTIPKGFAEIIENMERQDNRVAELIEEAEEAARKASKEID